MYTGGNTGIQALKNYIKEREIKHIDYCRESRKCPIDGGLPIPRLAYKIKPVHFGMSPDMFVAAMHAVFPEYDIFKSRLNGYTGAIPWGPEMCFLIEKRDGYTPNRKYDRDVWLRLKV